MIVRMTASTQMLLIVSPSTALRCCGVVILTTPVKCCMRFRAVWNAGRGEAERTIANPMPSLTEAFHLNRQRQAQRAHILRHAAGAAGERLPRAAETFARCAAGLYRSIWSRDQPSVVSLRELLGLIGVINRARKVWRFPHCTIVFIRTMASFLQFAAKACHPCGRSATAITEFGL